MTAVITTAKATSIQPTVSICAVYFGSLVSCSMIEEFDLADYSFVVKRRGNPQMVQKTFRAEFPCAGTPVTGLFERFTSSSFRPLWLLVVRAPFPRRTGKAARSPLAI